MHQSDEVVWSRALRPGYGWIFPAPGGCFNIGVGVDVTHTHRTRRKTVAKKAQNLRSLFQSFCTHHRPAAELMRTGKLMGPLKGAPLRGNLAGARWTRPGLLVTGEAAGSTYAFTGKGIGKAGETGLLAATSLLAGGTNSNRRTTPCNRIMKTRSAHSSPNSISISGPTG